MSQFRLIKINELEEEISAGANYYLAVDVPDPLSPTGYTTKKIALSVLNSRALQSLYEVLTVGNETSGNSLTISDGDSLDLEKGLFKASLLPSSSLGADINIESPRESGTLSLELETAWKSIPVYNGSYGLADTGSVEYRPKIKIQNRTVFVNGWYLIPMTTGAGLLPLDSNGVGYPLNFYSDVYQGSGDGLEVTTRDQLITWSPILPAVLRPSETWVFANNRIINRTVNLNGRTRLNAIIQQGAILSDGRMIINSVEASERNGLTTSAFTKSSQIRKIVDIFKNGDDMEEFDLWRNSHSGGFVTDNRVYQDTGVNWNFDHDSTKANNLGGYLIRTDFSYPLSELSSLNQIESAFNSL
jgi:hypothetical protein